MSGDAEVRERLVRIETLIERLAHDLKNYKQALDLYVPRRELDERFAAMRAEIDDLKASRKALKAWLSAAWLSGLSLGGSLLLKKF